MIFKPSCVIFFLKVCSLNLPTSHFLQTPLTTLPPENTDSDDSIQAAKGFKCWAIKEM